MIAASPYAFPLANLLHRLKYAGKIEYSNLLSQLLWHGLAPQLNKLPEVIIPVPLHLNRHKQRGFNQVDELLGEIIRRYPYITILRCQRYKDTLQQSTLNRQQRLANLTNAFKFNTRPSVLVNKHIALVDDVVTTGTTVNELAKLCKQNGARQIDVWCFLRAHGEL